MNTNLLRNPLDLGLHPALKSQPWMNQADQTALDESIREHGILQALLITADDEIVDGRHRWRSARHLGLTEVPCTLVSADDANSIILATILDRRHYSKGARAYLALPLLEKAVSEGVVRRAANLRKSNKPVEKGLNHLSGKNGSEDLAEKLGVSLDMLKLARNTASLFKQSDQVIAKWLLGQPSERELWEAWNQEMPQAWTQWREDRLLDMGEDPKDAKTAALIPESYREIYEELLFDGEMGLGQINKAIGGALATKGGIRADKDQSDPHQLFYTLGNKVKLLRKNLFGSWDGLAFEHRGELATRIATDAKGWPDEVRAAVRVALAAK